MIGRVGELAALGTAALWTLTYLQFTVAVRLIGADVVNCLRLLIALVLLLIAHTAAYGVPLPVHADGFRWLWLGLSGVVGFALSETFLFRALYHLGAHRTSVVTSLIPLVSAALAWGVFGERLAGFQILAGLITVAGIVLVVSARRDTRDGMAFGSTKLGVAFALAAVMTQSTRYLLSVQGMRGGFPILSTNAIQILFAALAVWLVAAFRGRMATTIRATRQTTAAVATMGGAITGPFLGVTLSLVALSRAPIGVASTLMALVPVLLLPLSVVLLKERLTSRKAIGTLLAVGGVALLFLGG